ncbi:hypothetical protein RQP46_011176 [Phenoliferia psychrophenolica]
MATLGAVGCAVTATAHSPGAVIAGCAVGGVGYMGSLLSYSIASEITPRMYRPAVQAYMSIMAVTGACLGLVGVGNVLFATGLTLFLVGMTIGGGSHPWKSGVVIGLLWIFTANLGWLAQEIGVLFEPNRFWVYQAASLPTSAIVGYISYKTKRVRELLVIGYIIFLGGVIGFSQATPGDSKASIGWTGNAIFSAIFTAKFTDRLGPYIAEAVLPLGLLPTDLPAFIGSLASGDIATLSKLHNVTPQMIGAGFAGYQRAWADSARYGWYSLMGPVVIGIVSCALLQPINEDMNNQIDAPVNGAETTKGEEEKC